MSNDNLLVSVNDAAQRLGISRMSVYRLIRSDALKTAKVRGRRLVSVAELHRFVSRAERQSN